MKRFVQLFRELDQTNKTSDKLAALRAYFSEVPDTDAIWALVLFTGRRPPRKIKTKQVQEWAMQEAGIPEWLFKESYSSVGDLAETISKILPPHTNQATPKSLAEWFTYLAQLNIASDEEKQRVIYEAWHQLNPFEIFVFNKLLMGSFRIGVSQTLVMRALSDVYSIDVSIIAHRLMGNWNPWETKLSDLLHAENAQDKYAKPYPFYLAYPLENEVQALGNPNDWFVEWKWDGIRAQVIIRNGEIYIWTRGEELATDKFPDLHQAIKQLPDGTVLDGEIACFIKNKPLSFNILQTRIGRKNISKKTLLEAPVAYIVYDVLELNMQDIRSKAHSERRQVLENLFHEYKIEHPLRLSELIPFADWSELADWHARSREYVAEGFMIKRKAAMYQTGRKKGDWWKWKVDPLSVDAVLIYAMKGSGRRAQLYTDYTFAVWDEGKLVPFAKAYSGLTDKEINEVDKFIKQHTVEKFGPVRTVEPQLVFEIGFEGINASSRHKSGIAVRFPRILRWRKDKKAADADTLSHLKTMLENYQ